MFYFKCRGGEFVGFVEFVEFVGFVGFVEFIGFMESVEKKMAHGARQRKELIKLNGLLVD